MCTYPAFKGASNSNCNVSDGDWRLSLGLETSFFETRSRALSLETLHELFFYEVLQEAAP